MKDRSRETQLLSNPGEDVEWVVIPTEAIEDRLLLGRLLAEDDVGRTSRGLGESGVGLLGRDGLVETSGVVVAERVA